MRFACSETPFFANHNGSSAETGFTNNFYAAFTRRFACRANTGPANHYILSVHRHTSQTSFSQHLQCDSEPARTNTMEITMAVVHRHSVRTSWPQPLQCDSQPVTAIALQITMAVTHRTAGGPAATTRAGGPSAVSEHCAGHCGESRAPSGDHARRRPFCSLWTLRRSNQYYGNHNGSSAQTQCAHILAAAITMRFAACHSHCFANHNGSNAQNRRGPSGDHARRRPFCSL